MSPDVYLKIILFASICSVSDVGHVPLPGQPYQTYEANMSHVALWNRVKQWSCNHFYHIHSYTVSDISSYTLSSLSYMIYHYIIYGISINHDVSWCIMMYHDDQIMFGSLFRMTPARRNQFPALQLLWSPISHSASLASWNSFASRHPKGSPWLFHRSTVRSGAFCGLGPAWANTQRFVMLCSYFSMEFPAVKPGDWHITSWWIKKKNANLN